MGSPEAHRLDRAGSRTGAGWVGLWVLLLGALLAVDALAAETPPESPATAGEIAEIRAQIDALRTEYEERLAGLEERLALLEGETPVQAAPEDDLVDLRAAARAAAGLPSGGGPATTGSPAKPAPSAPTGAGRGRDLSRLNPEISFTGIAFARGSDAGREEFGLGEFELDVQSALDPYSRTRWTVAFSDGEAAVEEGYIVYNALGRGQELVVGRFRQRFGNLNRQHLHALPQNEYPLVLQRYFGEEGLRQTGVSWTWLPSRPLASANILTLELTSGENEEAFGGEMFEDPAVLGHLKSFWDVGDAAYFEWGLSGISGKTAVGGDSRVWGTDLTYHWQPPRRAKYRELTLRTELLLSQRDDEAGRRHDAWGGYAYVDGLVARSLYLGVRFDRVEDPLEPESHEWGVVPYLSWWQSEYVRLRGEYGYLRHEPTGRTENRFTLQLTWAAGPHKHESY